LVSKMLFEGCIRHELRLLFKLKQCRFQRLKDNWRPAGGTEEIASKSKVRPPAAERRLGGERGPRIPRPGSIVIREEAPRRDHRSISIQRTMAKGTSPASPEISERKSCSGWGLGGGWVLPVSACSFFLGFQVEEGEGVKTTRTARRRPGLVVREGFASRVRPERRTGGAGGGGTRQERYEIFSRHIHFLTFGGGRWGLDHAAFVD